MLNSSFPEGNFRGNQLLDGSISLSPLYPHAPGVIKSAICIQRFDDSLNFAIRTAYHSWLRSSSMHEPRDPPLKFIYTFRSHATTAQLPNEKRNKKGRGTARLEVTFNEKATSTRHPPI